METKITKATIAEELHEILDGGMSYPKVKDAVDDMFMIMRSNILEGNTVYLSGISAIVSKIKEGGRPVRNPKTGETSKMHDTISIRLSNNRTDAIGVKLTKCLFIEEIGRYVPTERIAREFYNTLIRNIKKVEAGTHRMEIRGIGSFFTKDMPAKKCRNPKTGAAVFKEDYSKLVFRAGKGLVRESMAKHLG